MVVKSDISNFSPVLSRTLTAQINFPPTVDTDPRTTFITNENAGYRDGVALGNYINININDKITGSFRNRVISDPLFMHEYGHTFDSRIYGMSYLLAIGVPSIFSADKSSGISGEPSKVSTHSFYWTEMRANRHAKKYFGNHYNVDWNSPLEDYYYVFENGVWVKRYYTLEILNPTKRR